MEKVVPNNFELRKLLASLSLEEIMFCQLIFKKNTTERVHAKQTKKYILKNQFT